MEEILKTILENLVDKKDQVQVTRVDDEKGVLLKVKVDSSDMGKVIGKQGKNAKGNRRRFFKRNRACRLSGRKRHSVPPGPRHRRKPCPSRNQITYLPSRHSA